MFVAWKGHRMTVSAHDVARELRNRQPGAGGAKLHKLLYYCQGWHLARHREPMFTESISAWSNGPVVGALWRAEKYNDELPPDQPLDHQMIDTLELVLDRYGHYSGKDLIELTHSEPPWQVVSIRDEEWTWDNDTITREALREFFTDLDDAYALRPLRITPARQKIIDAAIEEQKNAAG